MTSYHLHSDHTRRSFASLVTNAISQARDSVSYVTAEEDNDEWLTIDAQDFDDLLQKSSKSQKSDVMDVDKSGETPEGQDGFRSGIKAQRFGVQSRRIR